MTPYMTHSAHIASRIPLVQTVAALGPGLLVALHSYTTAHHVHARSLTFQILTRSRSIICPDLSKSK